MECYMEAAKICKNATAFQEISNQPPIEKARVDLAVIKHSNSECILRSTLSEFSLQKDAVVQNLKQSIPSNFSMNENYKTYLENFSSFFTSRLNSIVQENIPLTIECKTGFADGEIVMSDLVKCNEENQNKMLSLFQDAMPRIAEEMKAEIEEQTLAVEEAALKLGEVNEVGYELSSEKTDFYSEGISIARVFTPSGTESSITELSFDSLKLNYSLSGLETGKFAVGHAMVLLEDKGKATEFYSKAYSSFLSTQSSEKLTENSPNPNYSFVKIDAGSGLQSYRLIYQEENAIVIIDMTPNEMDLEEVISNLETIASGLNKRLGGKAKDFTINCTVASTFDEVCETIQESEEYQEEECTTRKYSYQNTEPKGTRSDGFLGMGCYTEVETTISNQENREGAFTFQVTFTDSQGNTIGSMEDSKMIGASFSQKLLVQYSYDCSGTVPERYTHIINVPSGSFCEMVTKTRQIPKEFCEQKEIQELECS